MFYNINVDTDKYTKKKQGQPSEYNNLPAAGERECHYFQGKISVSYLYGNIWPFMDFWLKKARFDVLQNSVV